jgi:hypothetical protein
MGEEIDNSDENVSRMFCGKKADLSSDEELALHIIHKFNICCDTLETMPAFDEHLKPLFLKTKDK